VVGGIELLMSFGFDAKLKQMDAAPIGSGTTSEAGVGAGAGGLSAAVEALHQFLDSQQQQCKTTTAAASTAPLMLATCGALLLPLLHPHSSWDVHLEMSEPPIDSLTETTNNATTVATSASGGSSNNSSSSSAVLVDKLGWLDWFDSLGYCKAKLEYVLGGF
jgi:hypothetical protein